MYMKKMNTEEIHDDIVHTLILESTLYSSVKEYAADDKQGNGRIEPFAHPQIVSQNSMINTNMNNHNVSVIC